MRARPISPALLAVELAARVEGAAARRVGIDGAPSAGTRALGDGMVEALRSAGHAAVLVDTDDFLRPASLRLERGRTNPDSFYELWYDQAALDREVLAPLRPGGSGAILTTFWDAGLDRATRAGYQQLAEGGVVVVCGPLLLGYGLDLDLTIHCAQSAAALRRRMPQELAWTLPAYERYAAEVRPDEHADVVVLMDDPTHPALVE